jgi:hypothetical protein
MQCKDVIRQLVTGTDEQLPADLAEHLAGCAACSEWAKRASALDRLWEATRPAAPSPQVWESMWDRIAESLDAPAPLAVENSAASAAHRNGWASQAAESIRPLSPSVRHRSWWITKVVAVGLAQAAAVLVVVSLAWRSIPALQNPPAVKQPALAVTTHPSVNAPSLPIDIEEGSLVVIQTNSEKPEVSVLTLESSPFAIDEWLVMFNKMESMAPNSVVAMKE